MKDEPRPHYAKHLQTLKQNHAQGKETTLSTRIILALLVDHYKLDRKKFSQYLGKVDNYIDQCARAYQLEYRAQKGFTPETAELINAIFPAPKDDPDFWTTSPHKVKDIDHLPPISKKAAKTLDWISPQQALFLKLKTSLTRIGGRETSADKYMAWRTKIKNGEPQTCDAQTLLALSLIHNNIQLRAFEKELGLSPYYLNNVLKQNTEPTKADGFNDELSQKLSGYFSGEYGSQEAWQKPCYIISSLEDIPVVKQKTTTVPPKDNPAPAVTRDSDPGHTENAKETARLYENEKQLYIRCMHDLHSKKPVTLSMHQLLTVALIHGEIPPRLFANKILHNCDDYFSRNLNPSATVRELNESTIHKIKSCMLLRNHQKPAFWKQKAITIHSTADFPALSPNKINQYKDDTITKWSLEEMMAMLPTSGISQPEKTVAEGIPDGKIYEEQNRGIKPATQLR